MLCISIWCTDVHASWRNATLRVRWWCWAMMWNALALFWTDFIGIVKRDAFPKKKLQNIFQLSLKNKHYSLPECILLINSIGISLRKDKALLWSNFKAAHKSPAIWNISTIKGLWPNYATTITWQDFLEKWVRESDEGHRGMTPPNTTDWYLTEDERGVVFSLSLVIFYLFTWSSLRPALLGVPFCVDTEITSALVWGSKKWWSSCGEKNRSWRHIGQFNYIILIRRNFQNIITVKYCASPLPQTFIILNLWILMRASVKTGSARPYFQGNRGHSYLLHQYPRWQVAQNISAFVRQVLWTKCFPLLLRRHHFCHQVHEAQRSN